MGEESWRKMQHYRASKPLIITLVTVFALFLPMLNVQAQEVMKCENAISNSLVVLKTVAKFVGSLSENQCTSGQSQLGGAPRFLGHTVSDLTDFSQWASAPEEDYSSSLAMSFGGVELLADRIDFVRSLVGLVLSSPEAFDSEDFLNQEEWVLKLGSFASVVAKADFLAGLMPYLVQNLLSSDFPLPTDEGDITLVFNLESGFAGIDVDTVLQGTTFLQSESGALDLLDIDQVTVKISNGSIESSAELDPETWEINRGQVGLSVDLGPNSITSTTVFSKGQGLEKQILKLTAQLGDVNLLGQATFGSSLQEFKLQARVADMLTLSTLLTTDGIVDPSLRLNFTVPFLKRN